MLWDPLTASSVSSTQEWERAVLTVLLFGTSIGLPQKVNTVRLEPSKWRLRYLLPTEQYLCNVTTHDQLTTQQF